MAFPADSTYVKYLGGGYHLVVEKAPDLTLTWYSDRCEYSANLPFSAFDSYNGLCAIISRIPPTNSLRVAPANIGPANGQIASLRVSGIYGSTTISSSDCLFLRLVPNE